MNDLPTYKAVLFDLDGTLIDSLPTHLEAYRNTLKELGFNIPDHEIIDTCFNKKEDTICEALGIPEKTQEFTRRYLGWVRKLAGDIRLMPDMQKLLDDIKAHGMKIGIITFAFKSYAQQVIAACGLQEYQDVVLSFDDVKEAKPAPEAVEKACAALGIRADEALVVGDAPNDILMGKNAGSTTVLLTPETNREFSNFEEIIQATHPDHVIERPAELLQLFK